MRTYQFCIVLAIMFLTGCAPVMPWERGYLAKAHMLPSPNAIETSLRYHMQVSKEASSGGHSSAGGGCGCN